MQTEPTGQGGVQTCPRSGRGKARRMVFHLMAAVLVLSPLVLAELLLRALVPAPSPALDDPYISFAGLRPLFVLNAAGQRYQTSPERLVYFCPQSFAAKKSADTFRVFCLGGSTVQGEPFGEETSFTTWLQLNLRAARPQAEIEVVNCGGLSYASYRLIPILREVLGYEPDLIILCTGHNEFLEDRTYHHIRAMPRSLVRLHQGLLGLRTYGLVHQFISSRSDKGPKTVLPVEVKARLDLETGLKPYHRDVVWRQGIIEHYRLNLETLVRTVRGARVPIILMNPVSNLKDCPPFKSEFRADLSDADRARVQDLWDRAKQWDWADPWGKRDLLAQALSIDRTHAGLLYLMGKCEQLTGHPVEARRRFVEAKDQDICPLRILEPMRQAVEDVSWRYRVPLVDMMALIEGRTGDHIAGDEWLLDHVHPAIEGHQLVADALTETLVRMGVVTDPNAWRTTRDLLWQSHLSSLGDTYFQEGYMHLKRLQAWCRRRGE